MFLFLWIDLGNHELTCPHPSKSGRDILSSLESLDREAKEEKKLYDCIFDLLSFEKITFHDLQFKGYRTEEFIHRYDDIHINLLDVQSCNTINLNCRLYYETARFTAFNNQWVVKARVNENEKDPSQVCDRRLSYQLVLKTKLQSPLAIHYLILKVGTIFFNDEAIINLLPQWFRVPLETWRSIHDWTVSSLANQPTKAHTSTFRSWIQMNVTSYLLRKQSTFDWSCFKCQNDSSSFIIINSVNKNNCDWNEWQISLRRNKWKQLVRYRCSHESIKNG